MTINTGVPTSYKQPQSFHAFSYAGGRSLVSLTNRLALIGNKSPTGTATAAAVVQISDPGEVDTLFGIGSPLALMARKAFEQAALSGNGPALFAVPLAETTTARAQTLTVTGPATADGNVVIRIAGRKLVIGVANGTAQNTIASAINTAINAAKATLPVTSGVATNVVTCTATVKGTFGADIVFEVVSTPTGVSIASAQSVAGAGALDIQTALDAIAGLEFDGVAVQTHVSGDITEILAHNNTQWSAAEKRPRWFFLGEPGTVGTATPLASAANHEGIVVVACEQSPSLPCEIATAAAVCWLARARPNANYDGAKLALYPPPDAYAFTNSEKETLIAAGCTPLAPVVRNGTVVDAVLQIVRLVTTRTQISSQPSDLLLDISTSRTAWAMAKQYDIAYAQRFGADVNPDGPLTTDDLLLQVRDMVIDIQKAAEAERWIKNVDANKSLLVVEYNAIVPTRIDVDDPLTVVGPVHQVAYIHRVSLG